MALHCTAWGLHRLEAPNGEVAWLCYQHLQLGKLDLIRAEVWERLSLANADNLFRAQRLYAHIRGDEPPETFEDAVKMSDRAQAIAGSA